MIIEATVFGVMLGSILIVLGIFGEKARPAIIVAGAICLLVTGVLLGADGLDIPTGNTVSSVYSYANITGVLANGSATNQTVVSGINETYAPIYTSIAGNYGGGWALMLIMAAVATFFVAFNAFQDTRKIE